MTMPVNETVSLDFRATMRRFPETVTVITAHDGKRDHGMTVSAVTSVSMEPPSLVVCLNNRTLLHEMLLGNPIFAVNVLGQEHSPLSDAFSGRALPQDRFNDGRWQRDTAGPLILPEAHAVVICRRVAAMPYGTHTLFVGQVMQARSGDATRPLLYEDAKYCACLPIQ